MDITIGKECFFHGYLRPLRLVEIRDPKVSLVVTASLTTPNQTWLLGEWWVLPLHASYWTEATLTRALLNSTHELVEMLKNLRQEQRGLGESLKAQIASELPTRPDSDQLMWYIDAAEIPDHGPVVRVIFGTRAALSHTQAIHPFIRPQLEWEE